jgi:hypothetical protein
MSEPAVSEKPSPLARNPLDMIASAHAVQVEMCDAMERIADGLPDEVDRRLCAQVASCLEFDLPLIGYFPRTPQPDRGVVPDVVVPETIDDIVHGRDRALAAAVAWLRG